MTTIDEFKNVQNSIYVEKESKNIKTLISKKRYSVIKSVDSVYGEILINNTYLITSKIVNRMMKFFRMNTSNIGKMLFKYKLNVIDLQSTTIVWFEIEDFGTLSFLQTRYDFKTLSTHHSLRVSICDIIDQHLHDNLHGDLTALANVSAPISTKDLISFDKTFILLKSIKSLVEIFRNRQIDNSDFVYFKDNCHLQFNSKILNRNLEPLMIEVTLSNTGSVQGFNLIDNKIYSPFYLEPLIDYSELARTKAVIDTNSISHLKSYKYKFIVGNKTNDWVNLLEDLATRAFNLAIYIKGLAIPLLYKNKFSLAIKIKLPESNKSFYCIGEYPVSNIFKIKTVMEEDLVKLNNRIITSLYSDTDYY